MPAYRRINNTTESGWIGTSVTMIASGGTRVWFNRGEDKRVGAIELHVGKTRHFWNTSVSGLTWAEFMADRKAEIRTLRYAGLL